MNLQKSCSWRSRLDFGRTTIGPSIKIIGGMQATATIFKYLVVLGTMRDFGGDSIFCVIGSASMDASISARLDCLAGHNVLRHRKNIDFVDGNG